MTDAEKFDEQYGHIFATKDDIPEEADEWWDETLGSYFWLRFADNSVLRCKRNGIPF